MTQMLSEKQSLLRDFREIINEILERTECYQFESNRQLENLAREIETLHDNFLNVQKETSAMLKKLVEREWYS